MERGILISKITDLLNRETMEQLRLVYLVASRMARGPDRKE